MIILAKAMELRNPRQSLYQYKLIKNELENSKELRAKLEYKLNMESICIDFRKFKHKSDEKLLANMQNDFFKYGKLLTETDIIRRFNEGDILNDLSIFLCVNGIPIGFGQIVDTDHGFMLGSVGILTEFRGLGLGKLLISYMIKAAIDAGLDNLYLYVRVNNKVAKKLYRSLGFIHKHYSIQVIESKSLKQKISILKNKIKLTWRRLNEKKNNEKVDSK